MQPKIAINLYSLRTFCTTPEDIGETLKKVRAIGYEYVQLSGLGPICPEHLKALLDAAGVKACATHVSWDRLKAEPDTIIAEHKLWECQNCAIGGLPGDYVGMDGYRRFAEESKAIGKKLLDNGIPFAYHNHHHEFIKENGRTGLEVVYEDSDPRYLFGEIDTYWVQYGGGDPVFWINKLAGRQNIVHFKDYVVLEGNPVFAEVGEGNLNWPAILKASADAGIEFYIVEQDECQRDPFESVAISYNNLKKMLA
jgi:sugar phosphate isomerase/epimerase